MTQSVLFLQHPRVNQFLEDKPIDHSELPGIASRILQDLGIFNDDEEPVFELVTTSISRVFRLARGKQALIVVLCDHTRRRQKLGIIALSVLLRAKKRVYLFKRTDYLVISGAYLYRQSIRRPFWEVVNSAMKLVLLFAVFLLSKKRRIFGGNAK